MMLQIDKLLLLVITYKSSCGARCGIVLQRKNLHTIDDGRSLALALRWRAAVACRLTSTKSTVASRGPFVVPNFVPLSWSSVVVLCVWAKGRAQQYNTPIHFRGGGCAGFHSRSMRTNKKQNNSCFLHKNMTILYPCENHNHNRIYSCPHPTEEALYHYGFLVISIIIIEKLS